MQCGHRCPSGESEVTHSFYFSHYWIVCGEDCSIQVCPTCATPATKEILSLKLNILTDEDSLENLLITLPECGHVFTVETLDGICSLGDYYLKDEHGCWQSLASPHYAERRPPMCPTCCAAITSLRYGRIFKSANLDILERNIVSHMSSRMNEVQKSWSRIKKANMERAIAEQVQLAKPGPAITNDGKAKSSRKRRKAILNRKELLPVPIDVIIPNDKLFNVSPMTARIWNNIVRELTKIYKDAANVCDIRSAHTNAWEATFSFLYEQEMDKAVSDPTHGPRHPEEHAMRVARMKVGIPQPRADKRFLVEATWVTLQIRFTLVELAQAWIKAVKGFLPSERREWGTYASFLLESCEKDIGIAYEIAEASNSRRQMTKTGLLSLRVQLEKCHLNIEMTKQFGLWDVARRLKFAEEAKEWGDNVEHVIVKTTKEHLDVLQADFPGWFAQNFLEAAKAIRKEWHNLERTLKTDTFYKPLSLDEKMMIVNNFCTMPALFLPSVPKLVRQHTLATFTPAKMATPLSSPR